MAYRILVLISRLHEYRFDNHSILPNALLREGHHVYVGDVETLGIADGVVVCKMFTLDRECHQGMPFPSIEMKTRCAEEFDLVWVLANPHPSLLLETFQLLYVLNQRVPFVNDTAALLFLNSKIALPVAVDHDHLPTSYVSNSFEELHEVVAADADQSWVLKPANEGCGADVYLVRLEEKNTRAILQSATGNEISRCEMYGRPTIGLSRKYVTMQRYVPHVAENEKRVLLSGGVPFSGFRRVHHAGDHRANVTLGAPAAELRLTEEEDRFCRDLARSLMTQGVYYAGIDMAYPFVLELNLVNPGGLNDMFEVTGIDQSKDAISLLIRALEADDRLELKGVGADRAARTARVDRPVRCS